MRKYTLLLLLIGLFFFTHFNKSKAKNMFYEDYLSPEQFGAAGNGIIDDTEFLIKMINHNYMEKKTIIINNIYRVSKDLIFTSSVEGKGTILTENEAKVIIKGNNLNVSDITINGNNVGMGLYVSYSNKCIVKNVRVLNVRGGGITFQTCDDSKAVSCVTDYTRGKFGDGIIFLNSKNSFIEGNKCSNFQRVGIVVDWSEEKKSESPLIKNNQCSNAIVAIDRQINAGIWIENCKSGRIENNNIKNTLSKGIVITPNTNDKKNYAYTVSNNIIENSNEGLNFVYATNQVLFETNNRYIDVNNVYEIGNCKSAVLNGSIYMIKNKNIKQINSIIRFQPSSSNTTQLVIKECENQINKQETPIRVLNAYGIRGNIFMSDCIGNFKIAINENSLLGDVIINNCELDYTKGDATNYFCNNTGVFSVSNSKIIMDNKKENRVQANTVRISESILEAKVQYARLFLGQYGSENLEIDNSIFNNIYFSDIVRPNTKIKLDRVTASDFPASGFINSTKRIKEIDIANSTFYSRENIRGVNIKALKSVLKNNKNRTLE